MMREEFRSVILREFTNMRAAMKGVGKKGDRYITKYPQFTPFSREKIDIYRTYYSTIYGNDDVSKFFPRGGCR